MATTHKMGIHENHRPMINPLLSKTAERDGLAR